MIALMNGTITGNELSGAFGTKAEDELGISIELQASHTALMDVTVDSNVLSGTIYKGINVLLF